MSAKRFDASRLGEEKRVFLRTCEGRATDMKSRSYAYVKGVMEHDSSFMAKERMSLLHDFEESGIRAHGRVFDVSCAPLLYSGSDQRWFDAIVKATLSVLEKMTIRFIQDAEYRKIFRLSKGIEELILTPPAFPGPCSAVGRIDIFFTEGGFEVCEVNTDGSGGMSRSDFISPRIAAFPELRSKYPDAVAFKTAQTIARRLSECYFSAVKRPKRDAFFAIADFREEGVFSDFELFEREFEALGLRSAFVDVRDMAFDGDDLFDRKSGRRIDAVYRRAVTSRVVERIGEVPGLITAYKSGKAFLMGDFRSSLMHSKSISAGIFHPQTMKMLSSWQKRFVMQHFPETYYFDEDGMTAQTMEKARSCKSEWVLKPYEGFGSKGVICGKDADRDEWLAALSKHFNSAFILQRFCKSMTFPCVRLKGDARFFEAPVMVGLYYALGDFAGIYARSGENGIIDFDHGGMFHPAICVGGEET